jgi:4-amino-4-deoxy-L-arabinose transferase-like glycosyltransferase
LDKVKAQAHMKDPLSAASSRIGGLGLVPNSKPKLRWRAWWLAGVLLLVSVVVLRGVRVGEFDYNVDEAQHAVTGLFMADALRDLPVRHPIEYAYNYYAQYPAVAIVHWPPLFYVLEGVSFLVLGPSAFAARLVVLLFTLLLLYQWYRLVESLEDSLTAIVCAAVLGLLPMMLLFEKTVMLEIPSLALGVAAIRAWMDYLEDGRRVSAYRFGLWMAAALLCKQTSVYLLVFCALTIAVTHNWNRLLRRELWIVAAMNALLVGPFYAFMLVSQGRAVANDLGSHQLTGVDRFTFYLRALPLAVTGPVLVLAVLGIALSAMWDKRWNTQIMLCWVVAGYLTFTFFGQRDSRFDVYWLPPLVYFAVGPLTHDWGRQRLRMATRTLALVGVGILAVKGWQYRRPYIAGFEQAAAQLVNTYKSGIVLFDGEVPGNFVFYMRALDPAEQFLVLRKSLYVNDIREGAHSEELLHTPEELLDLLRDDGVRFIVVMDHAPIRFRVQQLLRNSLQSDQFVVRGRFPIMSNEADWRGRTLVLYENKKWVPPSGKVLRLRMLTLNHDIIVPLDHFNFIAKQPSEAQTGTK